MKHRTTAIVLVTALLLFLMAWSFASSAASSKGTAGPTGESTAADAQRPDADEEDEAVDADLGKHASKIDHDEYLRLRGEYFGRLRGIEPGRPFDPSMRSQAIGQMDRQEKNRKIESLVNGSLTPPIGVDAAWTPLGPTSITNGQALSSGNNGNTAISGRVTAIVVDPSNANNVYLGTAQGGVWRSTDGGTTWAAIFDSADSLAIGALAMSPADTTKLYVGTGEFNGCGDCFFGAGLYRIDTVNTTPTLVGPINNSQTFGSLTYSPFNGRGITKIVVDPSNAATIFVATGRGIAGSGASSLSNVLPPLAPRGLFRSTNATSAAASVSFQKLVVTTDSSVDSSPQTGNVDTTDIVMEPGVPNNLLVAVIGAATTGGIFRTTNALAATPSFTAVFSAATTVRTNLTINKVGLVITAYAATSEQPNNTGNGCNSASTNRQGALHKQVDPFNVAAPNTWVTQLTGGGGFCGGQCFYNITIAVNPNDANEVYLGGNARNSTPACSDGMKKSTDGGATFSRDDNGLHADSHALFYDGAGATIFAGNDGGIWKRASSGVPGAAGTLWTNLNSAPLNTLQFESIAVHPTDRFLMIGGTQDNGTEYQQTSAGNWSNAEGGDGGYALIDQSATDTENVNMYHTFFNQTNTQLGFDREVKVSCLPNKNLWPTRGIGFVPPTDAEQTTISCDGTADYLHNGITITDNVLFYAPMALGPGTPNTVYFGSDRLYRSSDRGDTMTVVSQAPISGTSPISSIGIWRGGDNVRIVGMQNGRVFSTSTGSSTLTDITSGSFPTNPNGSITNKFVGRAVIDPNNKDIAYVTFSFFAPAGQGIWKITNLTAANSGATPAWTASANGIPSIPINALVVDPLNSNNMYAGTDIGVYMSADAGANWTPFGTGLPRAAVFDLQIQPTFRVLRAGTHGRGVWETPLAAPAGPSTFQFQVGADSVTEGQVSKSITITRIGDTSIAASVNYATSDTSGANNCNVIGAAASARCDYVATSGTLNFAANEPSKAILVPIVDDTYKENAEVFTVTLTGASGSNVTIGSPATITITINDNDAATGPSFVKDGASFNNSFFVRQQYIDFLNREPDAPGLAFWKNQLDECENATLPAGFTNAQNCREVRRTNVSAAFFLSIEFQDTGYLVYRMYKAAYGDGTGSSTCCTTPAHNISVPIIRLNEFLPDTQRIGQGVIVGQGNWQQQLDDNKSAFAEEFVQRARFLTAYPLTMTPAQFVDALNSQGATPAVTGVKPLSQTERDALVTALTQGTKTRGQVVRAVAEDQTLTDAEFNRAFVLMQFFGYLRRNPNDLQDTDYTGYDFWLGKLNQFNGNFVNADMVKSFLVSGEYVQRFGTP